MSAQGSWIQYANDAIASLYRIPATVIGTEKPEGSIDRLIRLGIVDPNDRETARRVSEGLPTLSDGDLERLLAGLERL